MRGTRRAELVGDLEGGSGRQGERRERTRAIPPPPVALCFDALDALRPPRVCSSSVQRSERGAVAKEWDDWRKIALCYDDRLDPTKVDPGRDRTVRALVSYPSAGCRVLERLCLLRARCRLQGRVLPCSVASLRGLRPTSAAERQRACRRRRRVDDGRARRREPEPPGN